MRRETCFSLMIGALVCVLASASLQQIVPALDAFIVAILAGYGAMLFAAYLFTVYGKQPKP